MSPATGRFFSSNARAQRRATAAPLEWPVTKMGVGGGFWLFSLLALSKNEGERWGAWAVSVLVHVVGCISPQYPSPRPSPRGEGETAAVVAVNDASLTEYVAIIFSISALWVRLKPAWTAQILPRIMVA